MNRLAQAQTGLMASNPASGISEIPINQAAQQQEGVAQGGQSAEQLGDQMLDVLNQIANSPSDQWPSFQSNIDTLLQQSQNPQIQQKLTSLRNSLQMTQVQSYNPETNEPEPTAAELAKKLADEVRNMLRNQPAENTQESPLVNAQNGSYNLYRESQVQEKHKKKTKGNPFRVLMGRVGKLLDHGLEKSEIVRYLKKQMPGFGDEMISRAVDIVKDYNKKKHNKPARKADPKEQAAAEASDEKRNDFTKETAFQGQCTPLTVQASTPFNLMRYATNTQVEKELYNVTPEWEKRSTAELIARLGWLTSLKNYDKDTPQGDRRNAASKKGVDTQIKAIKSALKGRGFEDNEISE